MCAQAQLSGLRFRVTGGSVGGASVDKFRCKKSKQVGPTAVG